MQRKQTDPIGIMDRPWPKWIWLAVIIPGILDLYLITTFVAVNNLTAKIVAVVSTAGALGYAIWKRKHFSHGNIVFLMVSLFVLFTGLSTLNASCGKFAIDEYIKMMVAYALFLVIYVGTKKDSTVRFIMHASVVAIIIVCLLTLDGATLQVYTPTVKQILFSDNSIGYAYYDGTRLWGFWGNPNVFTTITGINLFLSYYLYLTSDKKWKRLLQSCFMVLMAYLALMAMSLGGIASLGMAVVGFLILAPREERLLHGIRVGGIFIFGVLIQLLTQETYTIKEPSGSILPWLLVICFTLVFFLCEPKVTQAIAQVRAASPHVLRRISIGALGLVVLIVALAFILRQPAELTTTNSLFRIIYPDPGEYTLTVDLEDGSQGVLVKIDPVSQNELLNLDSDWAEEWILQTGDIITIQVPEDCVRFRIEVFAATDEGATMRALTVEGESSLFALDMEYPLVPESMVSRLQGLRNNGSVLLRQQFAKDSWELFKLKPIMGHGAGGFEYGAQRVQPFRYISTDPHNQFLQVLVEGGLVGLLLYIGMFAACFYTLIKSLKKNKRNLFLTGALLMVLIHGFNEYSMSAMNCMIFAYTLLALVAHNNKTDDPPDHPVKKPLHNKILFCGTVAYTILLIPICGNIVADYRTQTQPLTFDLLHSNALIDIYEKNDYKISYVLGPVTQAEEGQAQIYLEELSAVESNDLSIYLAQYYLEKQEYDKISYYINDYIDAAPLNAEYWETAITLCLSDGSEEAIAYIYEILDRLIAMNQTAISPVYLSYELGQAVEDALYN